MAWAAPPDRAASAATEADAQKHFVEGGGLAVNGLDATDAAVRGGGGYVGLGTTVAGAVPIFARYSVSEASVVDRIAQPAGGPLLDSTQSMLRHTAELGVGYRVDLMKGDVRPFLMPYVSPRAMLLVDKLAPQWAFEVGGGARAGLRADSFELSGFAAFHGAVAQNSAPRIVYGAPQAELRFGGDVAARAAKNFWLTLGYEGDVTQLQFGSLAFHQAHAGFQARF